MELRAEAAANEAAKLRSQLAIPPPVFPLYMYESVRLGVWGVVLVVCVCVY